MSGGSLMGQARAVPPPAPPPKQSTAQGPASDNRERLSQIAGEMLRTFGAGTFAGMARNEIYSRTTDETARAALKRVHALTAPPYR